MRKFVADTLATCEHCNRSKAVRRKAHRQYNEDDDAPGVAEEWGFDFYAHEKGHILTIMELAGGYVVFKFLKSKEAKGVANILMEVVRFGHGVPKRCTRS